MWPFKPIKWDKLGNAWTGEAIKQQFNRLSTPPAEMWARDRYYQALPRRDYSRLAWRAWTPTDYPEYKAESFDCDDFADCYLGALKCAWGEKKTGRALAFGYVEAIIELTPGKNGRHAFIWAMDNAGSIYYIEPQTGGLMTRPVVELCLVEI